MSAASLVSKSVTLMQHMLGKSALHLLFYLNRNFGSSCFQMQLCQCWTHFFFLTLQAAYQNLHMIQSDRTVMGTEELKKNHELLQLRSFHLIGTELFYPPA